MPPCRHVLALVALAMAVLLTACQRRIPPEFEYPPGWITEEHPIVQSKSLSGRVIDPSGAPVKLVLVERMTPDFKQRLAATLTNHKGEFLLHGGPGKYYLRFRYRAFNDYLIPVAVTRSSSESFVVRLEVSN